MVTWLVDLGIDCFLCDVCRFRGLLVMVWLL